MRRRTRIILTVAIIVFLTTVTVPITLEILFPAYLLHAARYLLLAFSIPYLLFIFHPAHSQRIPARVHNSIWFLRLLALQIGAICLYVVQTHTVLPLFTDAGRFHLESLITQSSTTPFSFPFSPWFLVGALIVLYTYDTSFNPFRLNIPWIRSVLGKKITNTICQSYVRIATQTFITLNFIVAGLVVYMMIMPDQTYLSDPLNGLLGVTILLYIFNNTSSRKLFARLHARFPALSWYLPASIVVFAVLCASVGAYSARFTHKLLPNVDFEVIRHYMYNVIPIDQTVQLWDWIWWTISAPLLASAITRVAGEKKLRTVLAAVFVLPGGLYLYHLKWHTPLMAYPLSQETAFIVTIVFWIALGWMLLNSHHQSISLLGIIPGTAWRRKRQLEPRTYWSLMVGLTGILFLLGLTGVVLFSLIIALPLGVILALQIVKLGRIALNHQTTKTSC